VKRGISITAKIFSGFLLIIILSSLFLIISYPLLSRVQRLSQSTVVLAEITREVESIDNGYRELTSLLETYLEVGSKTSQKNLEKGLNELVEGAKKLFEQIKDTKDEKSLFQELYWHILTIQNDIEELFRIKEEKLSSYFANKRLIAVLSSEDEIDDLLEKILGQNMLMLEGRVSLQRYEINNLLRYFLFIEIGIILSGVAMAIFLSRFIVAGLYKLQKYTRAVSRGNFATNIDIDSSDEIGALADSFKKMSENLDKTTTSVDNLNQEIVERKKAEEGLKASEKRNRTWLESSPVCTKIVDLDFNLQYMSAAGVRDLKIEDITQHYGKPYPFDFYPDSFRNTMTKNLQKVKETGEVTTQEASVVDVEGNELWYHSTLVPVNDDEDRIDYIIVVSMEITERKRAENEKVELEKQLQHAQKIESIGTMANGIAHNFNNILGAIRGLVDMALLDIPSDSRSSADLKKAIGGIEDAKELSNKMLIFSSKQDTELKPIKIHMVIREGIELFKASMPVPIKIKQKINSHCGPILANPNSIKQIVMNLCTNANHALEGTGGELEVGLEEIEVDDIMALKYPNLHSGKYALLTVKDTGKGMDQAVMERIFEPFFTTKRIGKGTGLGLSVIHGIIMNHNGEIIVDSQVGKGTTFNVYLPLAVDSDTKNREEA